MGLQLRSCSPGRNAHRLDEASALRHRADVVCPLGVAALEPLAPTKRPKHAADLAQEWRKAALLDLASAGWCVTEVRIGFDVSQTGALKAGCGYFADSLARGLIAADA